MQASFTVLIAPACKGRVHSRENSRPSIFFLFTIHDSRLTIHAFLFLTAVIFLGIRLAGVIIYPKEEIQLAEQKGF